MSAWDWPPVRPPWVWPPTLDGPPPPPPSALLVDYWHSEIGVSMMDGGVQTWTSRVRDIDLNWVNARPAYAPDGTNFRARNVVLTSHVTGASLVKMFITPPVISGGGKPYIFAVYRVTAFPGDNAMALHFSVGGAGVFEIDNNFFTRRAVWDNGGRVASAPGDLLPHAVQAWEDTSARMQVDDTLYTGGPAGVLSGNVDRVSIGCASFNPEIWWMSAAHAFYAIYSAKPPDDYIASLRSWASDYWGLP